ncbi:MAG: hypothetical protein R3C05_15700 [Pirellulaceae bacterium]
MVRSLLLYTCMIVVAVAWMATGRAYGSCGDWLANPGHADSDAIASPMTLPSAGHPQADGSMPTRPCDCEGPQCGKAPGLPAPSPVPIPSASERLATIRSHAERTGEGDDASSQFSSLEKDASPRDGYSRGIDRPPREC